MVCITRIFGGLLAGFLGLIFSPNLFASGSFITSSEAMAACQSYVSALHSYNHNPQIVASAVGSCLKIPSNMEILGQAMVTSPEGQVRYCRMTSSGNINNNLCSSSELVQFNVFSYTIDDDEPEPDPCSSVSDFVSTSLFAGSPNGSGNACYSGCSYSVFIGYVGTYPAGYLEADWASNSRSCDSSDSTPVNSPPGGSLDLPPSDGGVDTGAPDPGPGQDDDGKGSSSGGGTCDSPPACSGDAIQCNILFQTWSTRCEAEKIANEGLSGEAPEWSEDFVDGIGEVVDSVDGLRSDIETNQTKNEGFFNNIISIIGGLRDDLSGAFSDGGVTDGAGLSEVSGLVGNKTFSPDDIDTSGWGFPRQCPLWQNVSFNLGSNAVVIPLADFTLHCDIFTWTGYLIVAFAAFWSSMLIIRGD